MILLTLFTRTVELLEWNSPPNDINESVSIYDFKHKVYHF